MPARYVIDPISVYYKIHHSLLFPTTATECWPWGLSPVKSWASTDRDSQQGHRLWPTRRRGLWLVLLLGVYWMLSPTQESFIPNHCRGFLVHTRELFACFPVQHYSSPYKTGTLPQVPALLVLTVCRALSRVHSTGANIPWFPLPDLEKLPGDCNDYPEYKCEHEHRLEILVTVQ